MMKFPFSMALLVAFLSSAALTLAWSAPFPSRRQGRDVGILQRSEEPETRETTTRRRLLASSLLLPALLQPQSAHALVKGNAPPPKKSASSDTKKCTNVEECQAQAEARQEQERLAMEIEAVPSSTTKEGTKYRDMEVGMGPTAVDGDAVTLYYKVLKLGKRSYDGLSGEGTVVFSRGYGLEDDERQPGDNAFLTTLGGFANIAALNHAVIGMQVGGTRRIRVLPVEGWRKPDKACDGGPGGVGTGGDLRTDYVVVPTATMVAEEACFDSTKLPYPTTYAQQRRMAQRFDQSLILEVKLVSIDK